MRCWQSLLDVLAPRVCAGCGVESEVLCADCRQQLTMIRKRSLKHGLNVYVCGSYRGALRNAILAWKDHDDYECGRVYAYYLAELMKTHVMTKRGIPPCDVAKINNSANYCHADWHVDDAASLADTTSRAPGAVADDVVHDSGAVAIRHQSSLFDPHLALTIVPIPSSRPSIQRRGWWQTWHLAQQVRKELRRQGCVSVRVRYALRLTGGIHKSVEDNAQARSLRLSGRLRLASRRVLRHLRQEQVVLLDDIVTTGSTMNACAEFLSRQAVNVVASLSIASA